MPRHVGTPQRALLADRLHDGTNGIGLVHAAREQRIERAAAGASAQRAAEHGEHVAEDVAFLAEERKVDEAQVQLAVARAFERVVVEQARAAIFREPGREWMEQAVEVGSSRRGVRQPEESFHAIPERIRVQHEPRPRHDVGPVAGLVLLQQKESLMLLRAEPAKRKRDLAPITAEQPRVVRRGYRAARRAERGR